LLIKKKIKDANNKSEQISEYKRMEKDVIIELTEDEFLLDNVFFIYDFVQCTQSHINQINFCVNAAYYKLEKQCVNIREEDQNPKQRIISFAKFIIYYKILTNGNKIDDSLINCMSIAATMLSAKIILGHDNLVNDRYNIFNLNDRNLQRVLKIEMNMYVTTYLHMNIRAMYPDFRPTTKQSSTVFVTRLIDSLDERFLYIVLPFVNYDKIYDKISENIEITGNDEFNYFEDQCLNNLMYLFKHGKVKISSLLV
jgi:hypothetical protein